MDTGAMDHKICSDEHLRSIGETVVSEKCNNNNNSPPSDCSPNSLVFLSGQSSFMSPTLRANPCSLSKDDDQKDDKLHHALVYSPSSLLMPTPQSVLSCNQKSKKDGGIDMLLAIVEHTESDRIWNEIFFELKRFHNQHGHVKVVDESHISLNTWFRIQCRLFFSNNLSRERTQVLTRLDSQWYMSYDLVQDGVGDLLEGVSARTSRDKNWRQQYRKLQLYTTIHGHSNVSCTTDISLWRWLNKQRKSKTNCNFQRLTPERHAALNRLDPNWFIVKKETNAKPSKRRKTSKVRLPFAEIPSTPVIDSEMNLQVLEASPFQKRLLSSPSPHNLTEHDDNWDTFFLQLLHFSTKHGHICVPSNESSLYPWLEKQRMKFFLGSLHPAHLESLLQLDANWHSTTSCVDGIFDDACEGPTEIHAIDITNESKEEDSDPSHLLYGLPNESFADQKWNRCFRKALEHMTTHGNLEISQSHDNELYHWLALQQDQHYRFDYRRGPPLSPQQRNALNSLDSRWLIAGLHRYPEPITFDDE